MDEDEVIFIDEDERNAYSRRRRPTRVGRRPGGRSIVVPPSRRSTVIRQPSGDVADVVDRRPTQFVVQTPGRSVLGGIAMGELIEMAAQVIAAIQPLPGAPTAQGHAEVDVENLVLYQTALAAHAKRDEQLRTLGNLVGRLVR